MVQILNKMVQLKYPILEIWCCHKHITQLAPSRLKFDTKLRKVFPNNLAPQLCTSHSRRENIAPNFVCSFQPIKCKHVILRFLATFGTCCSSQMPSSRLKCGKKLIVCSGQSNACIQNQDFGYTLAMFYFLNAFLKALIGTKQRNMSSSSLAAQLCTNHCQRQRKQSFLLEFSI